MPEEIFNSTELECWQGKENAGRDTQVESNLQAWRNLLGVLYCLHILIISIMFFHSLYVRYFILWYHFHSIRSIESLAIVQHEVAHEGETGKVSRADFHDRSGRTVLILRPGKQVCSRILPFIFIDVFLLAFFPIKKVPVAYHRLTFDFFFHFGRTQHVQKTISAIWFIL